MHTGSSTLNFLLGDHLGSTSITTSSSGSFQAEQRYYPWGTTRYTSGSIPTTFQFTGQRKEGLIGLYFYGARWYDPAAGRFTQPDTVIPEQEQGVQAYDRYAYTSNNPVRYTDPTGHKNCEEDGYNCGGSENPLYQQPSTIYPINSAGGSNCQLSLPDCFGDQVVLKDFSNNGKDNPIPINEFEIFADKVAEDLNSHELSWPGIKAGRQTYDTPFYNGGQSERRTGNPTAQIGIYPADQQICIENIRCSGRSDINYIAQGMWGAAVGEPKPVTIAIAQTWKIVEYGETASEDTVFWLNYGYDYYQQWQDKNAK
jgi:RHS repeat-associated protein